MTLLAEPHRLMASRLCSFIFIEFHSVSELHQNVTDDYFETSPFVACLLQVSKHPVAALYVIVCTNLAPTQQRRVQIVQEILK
jgi:hypothetical protein